MRKRKKDLKSVPNYFIFAEDELLFLIVCIVLDISEYMFAVLLLPTVGDFLDIAGIIACFVMFRWVGVLSLIELVPGADIFPVFIITWLIWYYLRKSRKKK